MIFFWELERQIYGVWWGSFKHGCQNCILHVRRNNSRKIWCWGKKFTVLSLLNFNQIMFGVFAEKFRHGGQKTAFHVKRWSYQEWTNLSNNAEILNFFGNSSVEFTEFDGEASCTVLKTAFYVYEGTIREKSLFLSLLIFSQKTSYFLRKSFSTVVKSAFHVNGWLFQEITNLWNRTKLLYFSGNASVKFAEFG